LSSHIQICDRTDIRWVAVKYSRFLTEFRGFSIAPPRLLVRSQIWIQKVKERLKLDNLRTDHVIIQSELKYLIGAKIVDLKCRVFCGKTAPFPTVWVFHVGRPVETVQFRVEPNPEPTREFGPVGNTRSSNPVNYIWQMLKHNDQCTGLDYIMKPVSYFAFQGCYNIDTAEVLNRLSATDKQRSTLRPHLSCLQTIRMCPLSSLYHSRYIIWKNICPWSAQIYQINITQWCIRRFGNSQLWTVIPRTNCRGLGTRS
jgi:hypothetical protein